MKQELKEALEVLALELASDATRALRTARIQLDAEVFVVSAQLAQASAACAHEVEWAVSGEEHALQVEDSSYEELKSLVVPLAEAYASFDRSCQRNDEAHYYSDSAASDVTHGQFRALCRAVGVVVPDAPA